MFRPLLICALIALLPSAALAGPHLRWNACYGDANALPNRTFACDTNTGSELLVASYSVPSALAQVQSVDCRIDIHFASATTPAWWAFKNAGTCRQTLVTAGTSPDLNWTCTDLAAGQALAAYTVSYSNTVFGIAGGQLLLTSSVPAGGEYDVAPADGELFAFSLNIRHTKTTGTGACAGCQTPACFQFTQITLHSATYPYPVGYSGPADSSPTWYALWQSSDPTSTSCQLTTGTRRPTWGAIKSLYR